MEWIIVGVVVGAVALIVVLYLLGALFRWWLFINERMELQRDILRQLELLTKAVKEER